ncbi:MAG: hypothetical protein UY49_C0026G0005 [Microgenomates group bacterium GW2011_GWC1_49_7]|nr:MAG: hypothetical protein UY49_C0026G0005 [Microgenomates group bacterium GW2011_GWC1_49_7]
MSRAAELINVTPHYIRKLLREGKINGLQNPEGRWAVEVASLEQFRGTDLYKQDIESLAKEMKISIKEAVEDVEENFDCNIISYFASPGSPVSMIDNNDCMLLDDLLYSLKGEYIKGTDGKKYKRIGLFLHSGGGILESAIKFVDIIRQYANEYYVIVPIMAKSAATLMTLMADKQFFTSVSELGPVDPIIQSPANPNVRVPATAIDQYLKYYGKGKTDIDSELRAKLDNVIDPFLLGAYKTSIEFSKEEIRDALMKYSMKGKSQADIQEAVEEFTLIHSSHSYPITFTRLSKYGIGEKITEESKLKSVKLLTSVYQQFMANSHIAKLIGNREENKNITVIPINPTQQVPTRTSL